MDGERNGGRNRERDGDREKERDQDNDASAGAAQSRRPPYNRRDTGNGSDSQQQQQPQQQHRPKHQKRVVGGGAGRFHARVPSSKGLHKNHPQPAAKQRSRAPSPEPDRPPLITHPHRRTTSDLKLTAAAAAAATADPSTTSDPSSKSNLSLGNLKKTASQSNLPSNRNRSHVDIGKRSKPTGNVKRSSSHKDFQKLKGTKNQVHFDLGNDDDEANEDEWVDASASASPYLSRRGSVASGGQSPAKPPSPTGDDYDSRSQSPQIADNHRSARDSSSPTRQTARHSNYITSRLLERTPSQGVPPQMSTETASVPPHSGSPTSMASQGPSSLYGTPKTGALGGSGPEELVSRFVDGSRPPSSGGQGETDSYFISSHAPMRRNEGGFRRPQSLSNLNHGSRESASEDEGALTPGPKRPVHRAAPASQSRTQQKLNLQRASSSMEPVQPAPGVGVAGASLLVGSADYEHRDPRVGRLLERTGMEYLVVRRYQNPIARSIARLSELPGANKSQRIPKQNGTNGALPGATSPDTNGAGQLVLSRSLTNIAQSRPVTPRRSTSIRTVGARSSYSGDDDRLHDRMNGGSSYVERNDDDLSALLRNLWDKSTDLSASQD